MRKHFRLSALALAIVVGLLWFAGVPGTQAALNPFLASPSSLVSGSFVTLTMNGTDDPGVTGTLLFSTSVVTGTASGVTLIASSCNVEEPPPTILPCAGGLPSPTSGASLAYNSNLFDADSAAENFTITLSFTATCTANATIRVTASQPDASASRSIDIPCTPTSTPPGTGTGTGAANLISVVAKPNALICGGTATITANVIDPVTGALTPAFFHFDTTSGQILPQTDNTAILALLPSQPGATVRATTVGVRPGGTNPEALTGDVIVQNTCAGPLQGELRFNGAVAVVASPNVIACGGTAKITATARDLAGVIIPGTGFTFTTDYGVLIVGPPNTAASTSGTATLTLQPGMGEPAPGGVDDGIRQAIVRAKIGDLEGTVTVQQFCPGVTTDSSTAPGRIVLNPSQSAISCSGNSFIGAIVKDSKGQVPPETEVTFIATSGTFSAPGTSAQTVSQTTTRPSATVTPTSGSGGGTTSTTTTSGNFIAKSSKNGALNVIYNAGPDSNGLVSITAAAGAAFGTTTITVNCPTAIAAGASGAGGAFRPPSTGEGLIKPPNTGDAGLVVE